jgi:hypothetical protein
LAAVPAGDENGSACYIVAVRIWMSDDSDKKEPIVESLASGEANLHGFGHASTPPVV